MNAPFTFADAAAAAAILPRIDRREAEAEVIAEAAEIIKRVREYFTPLCEDFDSAKNAVQAAK